MHGLVRGENMELGRDSDTGGQVKLAKLNYKFSPKLNPGFDFAVEVPVVMIQSPKFCLKFKFKI